MKKTKSKKSERSLVVMKIKSGKNVQLFLNDHTNEDLDPMSLDIRDTDFVCRVKSQKSEAIFSTAAAAQLKTLLKSRDGFKGLVVDDLFYPVMRARVTGQSPLPEKKKPVSLKKSPIRKEKSRKKTPVKKKKNKKVVKKQIARKAGKKS